MSSCLRELADYCVVIGKPLALLCVVLASLRSVVSTPTGYASTVSRKLCGALHIRAPPGCQFHVFQSVRALRKPSAEPLGGQG